MTDAPPDPNDRPVEIDLGTSHPARIGDYLAGGEASFSVDRDVTDYVTEALPGGTATARAQTREHESFRKRLVTHLAGSAGIRQFLDLGTGIPSRDRTHEVAQAIAPESRVFYFLSEPVGLAHAHSLLLSTPEGATAFVHYSQLRTLEAERVLFRAATTLDFTQPVALLCLWVLTFAPKGEEHQQVLAQLVEALPSGSYLAISVLGSDLWRDERTESIRRYREVVDQGRMVEMISYSHEEATAFFDGLELVGPGVVPVDEWRVPEQVELSGSPSGPDSLIYMYGALGRKP